MVLRKRILLFGLLVACTTLCWSQLSLVERASGFINPVDIASAGDGSGRIFIVEQAGVIKVLSSSYTLLGTYLDITSKVADFDGELGLLGLAFDPNFENNGFFYVYYSNNTGSLKTILERYQVSNPASNAANVIDTDTIALIPQFANNHNGGDLNFGPDGYLYCGVGDGGGSNGPGDSSQILTTLLGKLIRVDPTTLSVEIWALGLRNPWRFSFDSQTGDLWIADVGQNAREEVNFVPAAENVQWLNYGWNCWEGTLPCTACGNTNCGDVVFPVLEYSHTVGRSVTGGFVTRGPHYNDFCGFYLYADYVENIMWAYNGNDTLEVSSNAINVSAFGEGEDGKVYCLRRSSTNGRLIEVVDASVITCTGDCLVTNLNDSGNGSLRNCIDNSQPNDVICFDQSLYNGTIALNSTLMLDQSITIQTNKGLNLQIDGSTINTSLQIPAGNNVTMEGIHIMGTNSQNGVIFNEGNLTMINCHVYGDQTAGAIFVNEGELNLENSTGILVVKE